MSARHRPSSRTGKLGTKLALVAGIAAAFAVLIAVVIVVQTVGAGVAEANNDLITRGWLLGLAVAVIGGGGVGIALFVQAGQLASRVTDLSLGISKMGRGTEVRLRSSGNDEVTALGRALTYLGQDMLVMAEEAAKGGGVGATMDPSMREMRDRALPDGFPEAESFEMDGAVAAGTRGGTDYYDCVLSKGVPILYLISNEGVGPASAVAVRMARDEVHRALEAGATARKALAHANKTMHQRLPGGVCAKATLLELTGDVVKLYQAGYRAPALLCSAGDAEEVHAEGIALGLDDGPVFEKGLRSTQIELAQGMRVVIANEAAMRQGGFVDHVIQHSAKHTTPFLNFVLGGVEADAGEGGLREDVVLVTTKRW